MNRLQARLTRYNIKNGPLCQWQCGILVLVVTWKTTGVLCVVLQLWNVQRTKNSPTTLKPVTTHAFPCLVLTLAVGWMMRLWRAVAAQRELTWTKNTSVPQRQSVCVTTTAAQHYRGPLLLMGESGELIS